MIQQTPQPPINRLTRQTEEHDFWTGTVVAVIGLLFFIVGLRHLTGIETLDGNSAWETQIVKAFSTSGLRYGESTAAVSPALPDISAEAKSPLDHFNKAGTKKSHSIGRVRVDAGASTPCPT